jgi:hypothetical protein
MTKLDCLIATTSFPNIVRRFSMAKVACPTCGHFFGIRDDQKGLVLACTKCKLSFRALDSVVTEQLQDAPKFVAATQPNERLIAGGAVIAIGIVGLIIVYSRGSSSSAPTHTSQRQTYSSEPSITLSPAPVQVPKPIPTTTAHVGTVNYSMVETLKDSWVKEGWRDKPKSERALGMMVMLGVVRTDIEDPADREATLDYIQQTIGTW